LINVRRMRAIIGSIAFVKQSSDETSEFVPLSFDRFLPIGSLILMNPFPTLIAHMSTGLQMEQVYPTVCSESQPGHPKTSSWSCPAICPEAVLHFYPHSTVAPHFIRVHSHVCVNPSCPLQVKRHHCTYN